MLIRHVNENYNGKRMVTKKTELMIIAVVMVIAAVVAIAPAVALTTRW